ncbi:DNA ligase [Fasciolopsis buskii]|uniref:DNA ligase n=1 Tax=Fasciolopsis buskii TaxID=27845 RepID=A0A8E0RUE0_9TREM|nr:DNA ligase [Fasciolopsis buski]
MVYFELSRHLHASVSITQDLSLLCQRIAEIDVQAFVEDKKSITAPDITLFVPFRPMLCERANSPESLCQSVVKLCNLGSVDLGAARILIETKYDGERIQIHKSGSTYRYWSRNCLEWTNSYGGDGDLKQGSLTPRLHEAFRLNVRECILDGEIMAFNIWSNTIVPKTSGFDVKRSEFASGSVGNWFGEDEVDAYQPCVVVFDVMYLNGKSLTTTPLLERRSLLKELFVQRNLRANEDPLEISDNDEFDYLPEPILDGTVYLSRWNLVPVKLEEVNKIFNRLIDARQEGLVAKLTVGTSPYLPGRRLHGGWWKLKPDYVEGLLTDLDCLVVGGCYLSVLGRRTKRIGHFICAVRDDRNHTNEVTGAESLPTFLSFCRVSSGLTTNQLKEINAKLRPHWKPYDRKHPNTGPTEWLRVTTERPDVWIAPQHSITFQIHASEISPSLSYAAGLTLRFPRIAAVREDKPWQDCLTVTELTQLNQQTEGKMAVRRLPVPGSDVDSDAESELDTEASQHSDNRSSEHFIDSAIGLSTSDYSTDSLSTFGDKPQASSTPKKQRKLRRDDQYRCPIDVPTEHDQSLIGVGFLSGYELCLLLPPDQRKTDLDLRVRKSGGTIVQNPGSDTFCIVADKLTAKIKNLIGYGLSSNTELPVTSSKYNVVRVEWLLRALDKGEMIQWKPSDMFAMTPTLAKTMFSRFDRFGDSFTEPISSDELRSLCVQVAARDSRIHSPQQWKLTSELLDELKSADIFSVAPLFSYYILALPHVNSLGDPSASNVESLFNRLMVADLRRLGAVVLYFDCNICLENIPELVQFVASQLGVSDRQSSSYSGPKLSHILLLNPLINADDALCLDSLKDQLLDSCLFHPGGPLVVDKIWAKQHINAELCYPETAVDI